MHLPAEIRPEICRLLLSDRTIHIDGTMQNSPQGKLELIYNTCTANDEMNSLSHLTSASHSQDQSSATTHGIQRPCLSNHAFSKG